HDVFERAIPGEHVLEIEARVETEKEIEARLREIGVDQQDARAALAQGHRQIRREVALADAALAAGDRDGARARATPASRVIDRSLLSRLLRRLDQLQSTSARTRAHGVRPSVFRDSMPATNCQ